MGSDDETLSETVERLVAERPVRDLAGLLSNEEIEDIRATRTAGYESYANQRRETSEE